MVKSMKRNLLRCVCLLLVWSIAIGLPGQIWAVDVTFDYVENFNTYTPDTVMNTSSIGEIMPSDTWGVYSMPSGNFTVKISGTDDRFVNMMAQGDTYSEPYVRKTFQDPLMAEADGKLMFEARIKPRTGAKGRAGLIFGDSEEILAIQFDTTGGNTISLFNGDGRTQVAQAGAANVQFEDNTWYAAKVVVDLKQEKAWMWLDGVNGGEPVVDGMPVAVGQQVSAYQVGCGKDSSKKYPGFDDVRITNDTAEMPAVPEPPAGAELVSSAPADGAADVAVDTAVQLAFSAALDSETVVPGNFTVTPAVGIASATLGGEGKTVTVTLALASALAYETDYTISTGAGLLAADGGAVQPVEVSFRTESAPAVTGEPFDYVENFNAYELENALSTANIGEKMPPDKWGEYSMQSGKVTVQIKDASNTPGDRFVNMMAQGTNTYSVPHLKKTFQEPLAVEADGKLMFEARFKPRTGAKGRAGLMFVDSEEILAIQYDTTGGNTISLYNGAGRTQAAQAGEANIQFVDNTWYAAKVVVDLKQEKAWMWLDGVNGGEPVVDGMPVAIGQQVSAYQIGCGKDNPPKNVYPAFDDVRITNDTAEMPAVPEPPAGAVLVSSAPADGASDVAVDTAVQLAFSAALDSETVVPENFTITPAVGIASATLGGEGKTVTLALASALAYETDYTISTGAGLLAADGGAVQPVEVSFRTESEPSVTGEPFDYVENFNTYTPNTMMTTANIDEIMPPDNWGAYSMPSGNFTVKISDASGNRFVNMMTQGDTYSEPYVRKTFQNPLTTDADGKLMFQVRFTTRTGTKGRAGLMFGDSSEILAVQFDAAPGNTISLYNGAGRTQVAQAGGANIQFVDKEWYDATVVVDLEQEMAWMWLEGFNGGEPVVSGMPVAIGQQVSAYQIGCGKDGGKGYPNFDDVRITNIPAEMPDLPEPPAGAVLVSSAPSDGASDVAVDTAVQLVFSAALDSETVVPENFAVTPAVGIASATQGGEGKTVTLALESALAYETDYTISTGAGLLAADGAAAGPAAVSFRTERTPVAAGEFDYVEAFQSYGTGQIGLNGYQIPDDAWGAYSIAIDSSTVTIGAEAAPNHENLTARMLAQRPGHDSTFLKKTFQTPLSLADSEKLLFRARVMTAASETQNQLLRLESETGEAIEIKLNGADPSDAQSDKTITLESGGQSVTAQTPENGPLVWAGNTWYTFELIVDLRTGTATLSVDDVPAIEGARVVFGDGIASYTMGVGSTTGKKDKYSRFDDIVISNAAKYFDAAVIGSVPAADAANVALDTPLSLTFDKALDARTVLPENFSLTAQGGASVNILTASLDAAGRIVTIGIAGILEPNETYVLKALPNLKTTAGDGVLATASQISFTTNAGQLVMSDIRYYKGEGADQTEITQTGLESGLISASVPVSNLTSETCKVTLIVARCELLGNSYVVREYVEIEKDALAPGESVHLSAGLQIEGGQLDGTFLKVFIWKDMKTLIPYTPSMDFEPKE